MSQYAQRSTSVLQELRLRAGLSRRELAQRAGVLNDTIARAERGGIPQPKAQKKVADALSEAYGRPIDVLELWPLAEVEVTTNGDAP
jgi:transcriptional regulator with XRE-family HTH domain